MQVTRVQSRRFQSNSYFFKLFYLSWTCRWISIQLLVFTTLSSLINTIFQGSGELIEGIYSYSMAGSGLVAAPVENALASIEHYHGAGVIRGPRPVAMLPWRHAWRH